MPTLRWLVAGGIGGAIGVVIWVLVGYFANYEVAYIAWGVGALVGIGVRAAARGERGTAQGITAVGVAIASILVAKYIVVTLLVSKDFAMVDLPSADKIEPAVMIARKADKVVAEREKAGQKIEWPPESKSDELSLEESYPADVWAEGKKRWEGLSPQQQRAEREACREQLAELLRELHGYIRSESFKESFTGWDILWFGLAALTAFKLGAGSED